MHQKACPKDILLLYLDYLEGFPCVFSKLLRVLCHQLCELMLSLSSACKLKTSVRITTMKALCKRLETQFQRYFQFINKISSALHYFSFFLTVCWKFHICGTYILYTSRLVQTKKQHFSKLIFKKCNLCAIRTFLAFLIF